MRLELPDRSIGLANCRRIDVEQAFQTIAAQRRYAHHTRMPVRICQTLDYFGVRYHRARTLVRLRVFYLFIGVADDWLDAGWEQRGPLLLARLADPSPRFDPEVVRSAPLLAAEFLKAWIAPASHPEVLAGLAELYREVVREYQAGNPGDYFKARQATGRLTADVSYRLIADEIGPATATAPLRSFMNSVGAVGNLIDSLFDLPADQRRGLLRFRPTLADRLRLLADALVGGVRLLAGHPRLSGLLVAALKDTWQDARRRG